MPSKFSKRQPYSQSLKGYKRPHVHKKRCLLSTKKTPNVHKKVPNVHTFSLNFGNKKSTYVLLFWQQIIHTFSLNFGNKSPHMFCYFGSKLSTHFLLVSATKLHIFSEILVATCPRFPLNFGSIVGNKCPHLFYAFWRKKTKYFDPLGGIHVFFSIRTFFC